MSKITFIDNIGRTLIGEKVAETDLTLSVKNPSMINVAQTQNGQLQVQLIPLFFAEFISEATRSNGSVWTFNKNQIVLSEALLLDPKLEEQYDRINGVIVAPQQTTDAVINLFDDKE